jgi:hypothetical protein
MAQSSPAGLAPASTTVGAGPGCATGAPRIPRRGLGLDVGAGGGLLESGPQGSRVRRIYPELAAGLRQATPHTLDLDAAEVSVSARSAL